MAPTRPASLFVNVLVAAIVLAGVPLALVSGVALPVYLPYALVGALLFVDRGTPSAGCSSGLAGRSLPGSRAFRQRPNHCAPGRHRRLHC
jgi:uncharacterized membrane protein